MDELLRSNGITNENQRYLSRRSCLSFISIHWVFFSSIQVNLRDHIKRTETICHYLQIIEKLQVDSNLKISTLEELTRKLNENIDQERFFEIIQVIFIDLLFFGKNLFDDLDSTTDSHEFNYSVR